jgi:hypothetical protein
MIKLPMKKKRALFRRQTRLAGGDGHSRTLSSGLLVSRTQMVTTTVCARHTEGPADPAERRSSSNSNRIQELLQTTTVETD